MGNVPVSEELDRLRAENERLRRGYKQCLVDLTAWSSVAVKLAGQSREEAEFDVRKHIATLKGEEGWEKLLHQS